MGWTANSDDWGTVAVAFREVERPKFSLTNSANIYANAATNTTGQLTAPANKTSNNFQAGKISDDTNPLPSLDLGANAYTELNDPNEGLNDVTIRDLIDHIHQQYCQITQDDINMNMGI